MDRIDKAIIASSIAVIVLTVSALITNNWLLWYLITMIGDEKAYIIFSLVVYVFLSVREGYASMVAILSSASSCILLKNFFALPRPPSSQWRVEVSGYGLPSGHAMVSTTFWLYLVLTYRRKSLALLAVSTVLATSLSRIYLGVHYWRDIVSGWLFGAITGYLVYLVYSRSGIVKLLIVTTISMGINLVDYIVYRDPNGLYMFSLLIGLLVYYLLKIVLKYNMYSIEKSSFIGKLTAFISTLAISLYLAYLIEYTSIGDNSLTPVSITLSIVAVPTIYGAIVYRFKNRG